MLLELSDSVAILQDRFDSILWFHVRVISQFTPVSPYYLSYRDKHSSEVVLSFSGEHVLLTKTHKEQLIFSPLTAATLTSAAQHPYLDSVLWDPVTPFWQPGLFTCRRLLKHSSVRVAAHPSAALDNDVIDNSSSCLLTCETSLSRDTFSLSRCPLILVTCLTEMLPNQCWRWEKGKNPDRKGISHSKENSELT